MLTPTLAASSLHRLRNLLLVAGMAFSAASSPGMAAERAVVIAPPTVDEAAGASQEKTLVLAGGCFWGVQGVFQHVKGVLGAVSGYVGGDASTANYSRIGDGDTGHAEAVEIRYDPKQVSAGTLLQVFFSVVHDPTQLNRQGPDRGTQYRSAIFPVDDAQRVLATRYIAELDAAKHWNRPIVTRIEQPSRFYPAEAYHQDYLTLHPDNAYIAMHDLPKVRNLKRLFPALYRDQPVLVGKRSG